MLPAKSLLLQCRKSHLPPFVKIFEERRWYGVAAAVGVAKPADCARSRYLSIFLSSTEKSRRKGWALTKQNSATRRYPFVRSVSAHGRSARARGRVCGSSKSRNRGRKERTLFEEAPPANWSIVHEDCQKFRVGMAVYRLRDRSRLYHCLSEIQA